MAKSAMLNRTPALDKEAGQVVVSKDEDKRTQKRAWRGLIVKGGILFFTIKGMLWLAAGYLAWQSMP